LDCSLAAFAVSLAAVSCSFCNFRCAFIWSLVMGAEVVVVVVCDVPEPGVMVELC
jgi:hypothetical protein